MNPTRLENADESQQQQEIRSFFESHKIEQLFASLMDLVVTEQPEDPIQFMRDQLRQQGEKRSR